MAGARDIEKVDIHVLNSEIKILRQKITELNSKIPGLTESWEGETKYYNKYNDMLNETRNTLNKQRDETYYSLGLLKSIKEYKEKADTQRLRSTWAQRDLEQCKLELQTLERNLAQKIQLRSSIEEAEKKNFLDTVAVETTKKVIESLGLVKQTHTVAPPPYEADKEQKAEKPEAKSSEVASASSQKPLALHEKILQLQTEFNAEIADIQKRYNQKFEQIAAELKSADVDLRSKLSLS